MDENKNKEYDEENLVSKAREEKIKNFKISLEEDFFENHSPNTSVSEQIQNNKSDDNINSHSQKQPDEFDKEELKNRKQAQKEALKAEKKRKKIKAKNNGCLFKMIWITMVIIMGIAVAQFAMVGINDLLAIKRTDNTVVEIEIPKGAKISDISDILKENGVINETLFFSLYSNITGASDGFRQGVFEISKNKDYEAIINHLQSNSNRKDVVKLQFIEGMTVTEIAKKLSDAKVCDYDEFLKLCNSDVFDKDYEFLAGIDKKNRYYKLEGYLFPDTYDFYVGEAAEDSIRRFLANFRNKCIYTKSKVDGFDKKVNIQAQAEAMNYSLDQIIVLASIIQAEAASVSDMYNISSVFHNRLATAENGGYSIYNEYNMLHLESDATQFYPYKKSTAPKDFDSKYDTYEIEGLPAGAICCPGSDAIDAALNPNNTDYYYFCHKSATEDSEAQAFYASTLYYHEINKEAAGLTDDE